MKNNMKLLMFSAILFLLSFSIFAEAHDEYLHRKKHDWKKSFYGDETYTANVVFSKTWDAVKDSVPLIMEKSQDNGKVYMISDYKLLVDKCGENFIIFYFDPKKNTKKAYRFSQAGKFEDVSYNDKCSIDFVHCSNNVFDDKGNLYMFDYGSDIGVELNENNETNCIDKQHFEDKDNTYSVYGMKYVQNLPKLANIVIYDKKNMEMLIKKINPYEMEEGHLKFPYLLGTDKQLNVFVIMEVFRKNERVDETHLYVIYKISKEGEILTKIYPKLDYFLQPYSQTNENKKQLFSIDSCGNIYQLWLDEKNVEVIQWSR